MPKRAPFMNASVELGEEIWVVDLQYTTEHNRNSFKYRSVSHWEEYGEDFYSYEDALEHLKYEVRNKDEISGARIKRKIVQTMEVIVHEYDCEEG